MKEGIKMAITRIKEGYSTDTFEEATVLIEKGFKIKKYILASEQELPNIQEGQNVLMPGFINGN